MDTQSDALWIPDGNPAELPPMVPAAKELKDVVEIQDGVYTSANYMRLCSQAGMILEIIRAVFLGAIPVALFTFVVLQWSIASGRMSRFGGEEKLQRQHKAHAKMSRKNRSENRTFAVGDLFHNKMMSFGGGFYGTMAVLTYALIEVLEIWSFLKQLLDPVTWINKLGLNLLIEFFVNSLMNLVAAFVWFATLPDYIMMNNGFVWLAAAYAGYLAGLRLTSEVGDLIWENITTLIETIKKGK